MYTDLRRSILYQSNPCTSCFESHQDVSQGKETCQLLTCPTPKIYQTFWMRENGEDNYKEVQTLGCCFSMYECVFVERIKIFYRTLSRQSTKLHQSKWLVKIFMIFG